MLVGVGCSKESVQVFVNRLHCKVGSLPIHYLGLPIWANARSKKLWDPIVDTCEEKLPT